MIGGEAFATPSSWFAKQRRAASPPRWTLRDCRNGSSPRRSFSDSIELQSETKKFRVQFHTRSSLALPGGPRARAPRPPSPFRHPIPDGREEASRGLRSRSPHVFEGPLRCAYRIINMSLPQHLATPSSPRGQHLADEADVGARELDAGRGREVNRRRQSKLGRVRRNSGDLEPSRGLTRGVSAAMLKEGTSVPSPGLFERGPQTPDYQQVRAFVGLTVDRVLGPVLPPLLSAIPKGYLLSLSGEDFSCSGAKMTGIRTRAYGFGCVAYGYGATPWPCGASPGLPTHAVLFL